MQARIQCGFMAQNEDNADQHHRDMHMVLLTKQIESTKRLVELKMKIFGEDECWWFRGTGHHVD